MMTTAGKGGGGGVLALSTNYQQERLCDFVPVAIVIERVLSDLIKQ